MLDSFKLMLKDGSFARGEVYKGRTETDPGVGVGHAVACYGFGTLADGTKCA